jgi:hypothetical protein
MAEENKLVLFYFYSFRGTAYSACFLLFSVVNCQSTYEPLCFFIICLLVNVLLGIANLCHVLLSPLYDLLLSNALNANVVLKP